jgi:hypothetical protein
LSSWNAQWGTVPIYVSLVEWETTSSVNEAKDAVGEAHHLAVFVFSPLAPSYWQRPYDHRLTLEQAL